jgi:hypothetical protein
MLHNRANRGGAVSPPRRSDRELLRGAVGTPGPTFAKEAVREAFSPKTICRRVDLQVISLTRSLP